MCYFEILYCNGPEKKVRCLPKDSRKRAQKQEVLFLTFKVVGRLQLGDRTQMNEIKIGSGESISDSLSGGEI